jgi:hypothetical protein
MFGFVVLVIFVAVGWFAYQNYRREQLLTKSRLRDLLKTQNFKEADIETRRILLHISNREDAGYLRDEDILNLSCQNLREIDQLWSQYSNGKFGYTAQKKIWKRVGVDWGTRRVSTPNDPDFSGYDESQGFPSEVSWLISYIYYASSGSGAQHRIPRAARFIQLKFNINEPTGHLPTHIRSIDMEYDKSYGYKRLKNSGSFSSNRDDFSQIECSNTDAVYVCGMEGENHSHFTKALATKMDSCGF